MRIADTRPISTSVGRIENSVKADQRGDAPRAPLDVARQAASVPREMKAQAERVEVPEDLERDRPDGALRDLGEQELAQLGEEGRRQPQHPVRDQQREGHGQQRRVAVEPVDDFLQQQRHADVGDLGGHEAGERRPDPPAVRPEVGQQAADRAPVTAYAGRCRGCRCRIRSTHEGSLATHVGVRSHLGRPDANGPAVSVHPGDHAAALRSVKRSVAWTMAMKEAFVHDLPAQDLPARKAPPCPKFDLTPACGDLTPACGPTWRACAGDGTSRHGRSRACPWRRGPGRRRAS